MGDVIHVIRRHGNLEYRCGNTVSDTYELHGSIQFPFDDLTKAAVHMTEYQESREGRQGGKRWSEATQLQVRKLWVKHLERVVKNEDSDFFDLDAYAGTVNKITEPRIARTTFLLGDKEREVLRKAANYLMKERKLKGERLSPSTHFWPELFDVTIDKLTDWSGGHTRRPHPKLESEEVMALNGASRYIEWLGATYEKDD